jgi:DNA invertase Pin-like site-specific DNA recombinase
MNFTPISRQLPSATACSSLASMFDGIAIMQRVHARGAFVKVLDKPHLDLTTPLGRGFLGFLSALAEDERERITKRAADGRKAKSPGGEVGATVATACGCL